jgi:hypothetical protein
MTNHFSMSSCKLLVERNGAPIERQVKAIEDAIEDDPGLAIDLSRSLIESVCKTILRDHKQQIDAGTDAPKLFREVMKILKPSQHGSTREKKAFEGLEKVVRGMNTVVQGLSELRNSIGKVSHGHDFYEKATATPIHGLLAAQSTDAIVHYLYELEYEQRANRDVDRLRYEHNNDFNDLFDSNWGPVSIGWYSFRPSEVLFSLDPDAYREELTKVSNLQSLGFVNDGND